MPVNPNEQNPSIQATSETVSVIKIAPSTNSSTTTPWEIESGFPVLIPPQDVVNPCCNGDGETVITEALSARVLQVTLIASEIISALKMVYQTSPTSVGLSDHQNSSKKDVVGIALNSSNIGGNVTVLLFGRVEDPFFNFPLNDNLFLGNNGIVTNIPPISGYFVIIGKSLGAGAIFINIERTVVL